MEAAPDNVAVDVHADGQGEHGSTGADDELADAALWIGTAVGILRREAFVQVVVGGNHDVGVEIVEGAPQGASARGCRHSAQS